MAGPGGKVVDKISVRVVPNTENFRKSLDKYLERMERTLRVRVKVVADTSDFEREIRNAARRAQTGAGGSSGDGASRVPRATRPTRLPVDIDLDNLAVERMQRELRRLARQAEARIPAHVDAERFRRELQRMVAEAEGATRMQFGADMDPEARARLRRDIEAQIEQVRRYGREWERETERAGRGIERNRQQMNRFGREVDNSINNSFNTTITKIRRGMFTLGRILALVAALASPALGLVVGLMGSLPAFAGMFGAAAAAIMLGKDGIKAAARELAPEVDALKAALSQEWKETLTPIMRQLKPLFGPLTEGLKGVVGGLTEMAQGFVDVVTSTRGITQVNTILSQTSKFFADLRPAVSNFTQGFMNMAESGSQNFGKLSGSLNKFTADFQQMTERLTQGEGGSNPFDRMFTGLSATFDGLGVMFNKLFEAGVNAMASLGKPLGQFFASFGEFFLKTEPLFSSFSANILKVLTALMDNLGPILQKMTPSLTKLMDLIGSGLAKAFELLGQFLTPVAASLNSALLGGFAALDPILSRLSASLGQIAGSLGNAVAQAIDKLAPILPDIVKSIGDLAAVLANGIAQALPIILPLFVQLVGVFAEFLTNLTPLLPELVKFAEVWVKEMVRLLPELTPLFEQLISQVLPKLLDIVVAILPFVIQFLDWFTRALPYLSGFASVIVTVVVPAIQFLLTTVSTVLDAIKTIVSTGLDAVATTFRTWKAIFTGDWEAAWTAITDFMARTLERWLTFLMDAADNFTAWFRDLPQKAKDALGDVGSYLVESGKALLRGFITGMSAVAPEMLSTARNALGALRDLFPFSPAKEGPFAGQGWVLYSGQSVGEAFAQGLTDQQKKIVDSATQLMQAAKEVFGDTGQLGLIIIVGAVDNASKQIAETATQAEKNAKNALANTPKLDDATKREVKELELQADRLRIRIKELRQQADQEPNKARAKELKDEAKALQLQVDQLRLKAKEKKNGITDSGLDVQAVENRTQETLAAVDAATARMKPKGKELALALNDGVEDGLQTLQKTLRAAADQIGEAFGVDDIGDKWDKAAEKAKFNDIPKNFLESTRDTFLSDLGIGNRGFISQLFEQGPKIVYNVNSIDEVNANERNRQTREKAQYIGR
ncbi:hypothetical protein [Nocardia brasiliensis]|uniref:hypothetical protein n=1 Tax=Nocardia brasiliensis TaxID=37326 RepID=UPI0036714F64